MVYSVDRVMLFRRTAEYVDKILRGAKPELSQPTCLSSKPLGLRWRSISRPPRPSG
jgi:hypothetical protein